MPRNNVRVQTVKPEQIRRARTAQASDAGRKDSLGELRGSRLGVISADSSSSLAIYCHRAALVVELDGTGHQQQPGYDRFPDEAFTKLSIRTLRFSNQEVRNNPGAVVSQSGAGAHLTT